MSLDASIRPATPEDALCLQVLGMQVFLDTYATEGIRPLLAREVLGAFSRESIEANLMRLDMRVHVAEREGHLAGFTQTILHAKHELVVSSAPARLDRIYVQRPFTGGNVGKELLQAAEAVAREAGATDLWLLCWHGNHRALRFYFKNGFTDRGAAYYRMEDEEHENRVLAKPLADDAA
jgi:GNAT superfamily N-acetyltransferase